MKTGSHHCRFLQNALEAIFWFKERFLFLLGVYMPWWYYSMLIYSGSCFLNTWKWVTMKAAWNLMIMITVLMPSTRKRAGRGERWISWVSVPSLRWSGAEVGALYPQPDGLVWEHRVSLGYLQDHSYRQTGSIRIKAGFSFHRRFS